MAKYIDAELLRQEIERLKEGYNKQVSARLISESLVSMGKVEALNKALAFIESFQQEPDKNLEEAAEKYRRASCNAAMKPNIDGPIPEYGGNVKTAFIAGAEWMKNQEIKQPSLPDNLDDAANEFAVSYDQGTCDGIAQECFKAGALYALKLWCQNVLNLIELMERS